MYKAIMAAVAALAMASCAPAYAKTPTCDQVGEFAKDMLDDSVTPEDMHAKYDGRDQEELAVYASMQQLLGQVYATVPKSEHHKVPNVIVHLCYAKVGV